MFEAKTVTWGSVSLNGNSPAVLAEKVELLLLLGFGELNEMGLSTLLISGKKIIPQIKAKMVTIKPITSFGDIGKL